MSGSEGWLALARGGLVHLQDGGHAWTGVPDGTDAVAVDVTAGNVVVALRDGQLSTTFDGGRTWRTMDLPSLSGKAVHSQNPS